MKVLANGIYQIFFTALNDAVFLFDNVHLVDVLLYNTFHTTKLFLIPDWEDWSLYGNNRDDKMQYQAGHLFKHYGAKQYNDRHF